MVDMYDTNTFGGWNTFPDRVSKKIFYKKDIPIRTRSATITSGQVIKAYTPLSVTAATGKLVAHTGFTESNRVTFGAALTSGQTLIVGGLTWTAGGSGTTTAQLMTAFSNNGLGIEAGATAASLAHLTGGGSFTSGTLGAWNFVSLDSATLLVNATSALTSVGTNLAFTGTGQAAGTIVTTEGSTTRVPIAGYTAYDVNATGGDKTAEIYIQASFWADDDDTCAIRWASLTGETLTNEDGTTTAVSAFNTGCAGNFAVSKEHKRHFVAGSNFEELGFVRTGDKS